MKIAMMICVLLFAGTALAGIASADSPFPDTHKHWAKSSIQWALAKNMVVGYPDGTFKPDHIVTEAEFLAMLLRMFENTKLEVETLEYLTRAEAVQFLKNIATSGLHSMKKRPNQPEDYPNLHPYK
ncbi:S-layer homology domain-containing protein [Brevibacillus composti]|uniref:S-layer homology domain-containing protein n=1 Tax=Brevibacillus composti TaxID=2796470 RepID=A0A7T5EJX2_9BACL|nr:S-layer homology domain-containing protein [Brevibacillus composti]QQE73974.1 S-layer homology domain-containing protein [Brevibacillus composti]QUO41058.1 S-layer homology domain-containing protein [Brevibacillus composti]